MLFDPTKSDVTPPAQRVLSAVGHHHHWLALVEARREIDKTRGVHVHGTEATVPHREERRFIANSQPGASGWLTHPLAPKSFVPHHMQRLSVAAVKGDAKGVRAAANKLKRKVMGNAASAAAVGARA